MKPAVCLLLPLGLYPPSPLCALAKYLAVSRRNDPTNFGLPGGKEDPGESNLQAVVREVFEEVGLVIRPDELAPVYSGVCPGKGPDDTYWVTTYLWKRAPGPLDQQLKLEPGLVSDWRTEAQLTDPRMSPFAAYNVAVFNAYRQYLQ